MAAVKLAPVPTNGGDTDWRRPATDLSWSLWHARQLGFSVPTEVDVANRLLLGALERPGGSRVTLMTWFGDEPFILISGDTSDEQDVDDQIAMLELWGRQAKARRERRKEAAAKAIEEFARAAQVGRHQEGENAA